MVGYLALLLAWGAFYVGRPDYFWKGILIAALYAVLDVLWTYFRDKVWYFPESSIISGLILALVGAPAPSWGLLVLMPFLAAASKQLIWLGKGRHIFNPAAFSLAILGPSWWGVSWGEPVLIAVSLVGLFILWRQNRWETALPFLVLYALFFNFIIFDGTVLFFASVMLVEPITSNFSGTKNRVIYAALAAFSAFLIGKLGMELDPLLSGLLIGNIITSLLKV